MHLRSPLIISHMVHREDHGGATGCIWKIPIPRLKNQLSRYQAIPRNLIFFTIGCPNSVALKYKSNLEWKATPENHRGCCQEFIGIIWNHRFPCRVDSNLITGSLCHFALALPPAKHPHASSPLRPPTNFSLNRVHIPWVAAIIELLHQLSMKSKAWKLLVGRLTSLAS